MKGCTKRVPANIIKKRLWSYKKIKNSMLFDKNFSN